MSKKITALVILTAILVACSPVHIRMFPGAGRFPQTSPQSVDLLRREPPRPYVAFAEVVYNPPRYASRHEVDWVLRDHAARIGADALIIETDTVYREPVWTGRNRIIRSRPVRDVVIVGVAIRYR